MNLKRGVFVVGVLVSPLVITGCGGSSSSSSPGPGSGPDPIPGVYTISTAGGTGGKDGGTGGDGNDVELYRKASTG
ncbi:MAG: hypothetical protein GXP18_07705, partial [Gammaproteobacteria bacterium]|nr:hypothetical protein [Gammaproteobacteria bacterium]